MDKDNDRTMSFPITIYTAYNALREMAFGYPIGNMPPENLLLSRMGALKQCLFGLKLESAHNFIMVLQNARSIREDNIYMQNTVWLAGSVNSKGSAIGLCWRGDGPWDMEVVFQFRLYRLKANVNASSESGVEASLIQDHQTGRLSILPENVDRAWKSVFIKLGCRTGLVQNWMSVVVGKQGEYEVPSVWDNSTDSLHSVKLKNALHDSANYVYQEKIGRQSKYTGLIMEYKIGGSNYPDGYLIVKTTDDWQKDS